MRTGKARWLAATALVAGAPPLLALPLASATADEARLRPHQGPVVELGLEGSFLFNAGDQRSASDPTDDKLGELGPMDSGDYGQSFAATARWNLDERWAVHLGLAGTWLSDDESNFTDQSVIIGPQQQPIFIDNFYRGGFESSYAILDGAAVYRLGEPAWGGQRLDLLFGLRGLHSDADADYSYETFEGSGRVDVSTRGWYVGPVLGIGADLPLGGGFALVGQASGSVLFGSRKDSSSTEDGPAEERYDSNTVYTLEGSLALQYAIAPGVALQGGYRAQQLWNAGVRYDQVDKDGDFESGAADILVHGAFVRVNLSF